MNNTSLRRWLTLGVPLAVFLFFFMALGFMMQITPTSATPTDPNAPPPFVGTPATATLAQGALPRAAVAEPETTTFDFESGLPAGWTVLAGGDSTPGYVWGTEVYTNGPSYTGTTSVWSVGGGISGTLLNPISDTYPAGVDTWLVYGPLDMREVSAASLSFDYLLDVHSPISDTFGLFVSTNGSSFSGLVTGVNTGSWLHQGFNLSGYLGQPTVYVAFNFNAQGLTGGNGRLGAFVDNVTLNITPYDKSFLPIVRLDPTSTPTPSPTPTPTATPVVETNYEHLFAQANVGWETIRRRNTDDTTNNVLTPVTWLTPTFLEVEVKGTNDYVVLSPLVPARANAPYVLEVDAKFDNITNNVNERNRFSFIFGGDYDGVLANCPNGAFTGCFNSYYALQVDWRNDNQLYYQFSRITGHGAGNLPTETVLVGYSTIAKSVASGERTSRYTIDVVSNSQVRLLVNDSLLTTVNLPTPLNSTDAYFGLGVSTQSLGNARVRFFGVAMSEEGLSTPPPSGGGTGATLYKYEFNTQGDVDTWRSDAQGHSRTLFAATDNKLEWEGNANVRISVNNADQFVIYSPLKKVSNNDYWVEARMEFVSPTDQDALGLVFAGNRNEALTCPDPSSQFQTCFTSYYVVRLVYLTGDRINVRLEKVSRPSGSQNPNYALLGETTLSNSDGITASGMNTWKIEVDRTTGTMRVNVNARTNIISVTDTSYIAQYEFGLFAKTSVGNTTAVGRVDYVHIYEQ